MPTKVFAEKDNVRLVSDERDIMVPTKYYDEIIDWCNEHGITAKTSNHSAWAQMTFGVYLWRIKDEQKRVMFALRWAQM